MIGKVLAAIRLARQVDIGELQAMYQAYQQASFAIRKASPGLVEEFQQIGVDGKALLLHEAHAVSDGKRTPQEANAGVTKVEGIAHRMVTAYRKLPTWG